MEKGLKFLKRVQRVLAVDEAKKEEAVESVMGFGNRYQDRIEVLEAAIVLNPFRIDENSIDAYLFGGPDTQHTLYATRTRIVGTFVHELDEYRHAASSNGNRKGSLFYREAREAHHTAKSISEGVDILKEFEADYKHEVLSDWEPPLGEMPEFRAQVVAYSLEKATGKYREKITYKGVMEAYLRGYDRHGISKIAGTSSQRLWPKPK